MSREFLSAQVCKIIPVNLAAVTDGLCAMFPEPNKPLAAALYFSKELSRHGKGAAALLHFGHVVRAEPDAAALSVFSVEAAELRTPAPQLSDRLACIDVVLSDWNAPVQLLGIGSLCVRNRKVTSPCCGQRHSCYAAAATCAGQNHDQGAGCR